MQRFCCIDFCWSKSKGGAGMLFPTIMIVVCSFGCPTYQKMPKVRRRISHLEFWIKNSHWLRGSHYICWLGFTYNVRFRLISKLRLQKSSFEIEVTGLIQEKTGNTLRDYLSQNLSSQIKSQKNSNYFSEISLIYSLYVGNDDWMHF